MKRFFVLAAFTAALGVTVSGCHAPQTGSGNPPPSEAKKQTSVNGISLIAPAKITVYDVNFKPTGDQDMLTPREITPTHSKEPARDAVTALLQSPNSPIMPGTALRGMSVDGGVATVDFSRSPINETGGEDAQSLALKALALTLGQFPEINSYRIKVQGQEVKTFGEFTADGPMDVIRPGAALEAKGGGE